MQKHLIETMRAFVASNPGIVVTLATLLKDVLGDDSSLTVRGTRSQESTDEDNSDANWHDWVCEYAQEGMTDQEIADQLREDSDGEWDMTSANVGRIRREYGIDSGRSYRAKKAESKTTSRKRETGRMSWFVVIEDADEWDFFPTFYNGDDEEIAEAAKLRREFFNQYDGSYPERNHAALIDLADHLGLRYEEVEATSVEEAYASCDWACEYDG